MLRQVGDSLPTACLHTPGTGRGGWKKSWVAFAFGCIVLHIIYDGTIFIGGFFIFSFSLSWTEVQSRKMADISQRKFPHALPGLGSLNLDSYVSLDPCGYSQILTECAHMCIFLGRGSKVSISFAKLLSPQSNWFCIILEPPKYYYSGQKAKKHFSCSEFKPGSEIMAPQPSWMPLENELCLWPTG